MFDTMKIAKKIKEARIGKNMTQMNLADAMGVSYQAVSNWERGNSMPDISKLEDLCNALDLSVSQLLGMENTPVEKVLKQEPLTVEELAEVAPILPPAEMEERARKTAENKDKKYNIKELAELGPYVDEELMESLFEDAQVDNLRDIAPLAPYLSEEMLDKLVRKFSGDSCEGLDSLAVYLDEDTLNWAARRCAEKMDMEMLRRLAIYLDEDILAEVAEKQIEKGNAKALTELAIYMDSDTVRKIAKALMAQGDMNSMRRIAIYM